LEEGADDNQQTHNQHHQILQIEENDDDVHDFRKKVINPVSIIV
jgi:hypothetical protein